MRSYAGKSSIHDQMLIFWDGSRRGNPMDTCFNFFSPLAFLLGRIETGTVVREESVLKLL